MSTKPPVPKDAASIVLLRNNPEPEIFWVKRSEQLAFMAGVHAFPGGQLDKEDTEIPVANVESLNAAHMIACASRELFEETGVLLSHEAVQLEADMRKSLRQELAAGTRNFKSILMTHGLTLDSTNFTPGGRWVTPPFVPRRFDTWFFICSLPLGQEPEIIPGELAAGEWIRPQDALAAWQRGEVLLAPPTLHIIRTLAEGLDDLTMRLTAIPEANCSLVRRIEMRPGIILFPVRTPTLPPATHTNCYIVGDKEFVIIDPASPYEEDQTNLADFIDSLIANGQQPREIILTHFHPDHIGGVAALQQHLNIPIAAHALTKERVGDKLLIDREIADNDLILLPGNPGWHLRALHTPGHTRDHLCFWEERTGALISGDLIVGIGTVLIDPPEGNMEQYLASLRRVGELPLTAIFGAHGAPTGGAKFKIEQYISHRLEREANVITAIGQGATTLTEIVKVVYTDVSEKLHKLAERSVLAHIEKLLAENCVIESSEGYELVKKD